MAYTTKKSDCGTNLKSPSRNWDVTAVASRSSLTDKKVKITVTVTEGFGAGANAGTSYTAYSVGFRSSMPSDTTGGQLKVGTLNSSGTTWKYSTSVSPTRLNSNGSTMTAKKPFKSDSTIHTITNWTDSKTKKLTVTLYQNGSSEGVSTTLYLEMPKYSSSEGGGGGGSTTIGANTVSISLSPTAIELGESSVLTITSTVGTNNGIEKYQVYEGSTLLKTITSKTTTVTPTKVGSTSYKVKAISTKGTSYDKTSSSKSITVTKKTVNPVYINYCTDAVTSGGGLVYLTVTGGTEWAYAVGTTSASARVPVNDTYAFIHDVMPNTTIYVWGYDSSSDTYSTSYDSYRVGITYSVYNASININPVILKDNLSTPDLVTNIRSGNASAQSDGGGVNYTWQFVQSSTTSGLSSASYQDLGISGSSFNNLDMTQKVNKGYYYKIRVVASNSYGNSDSAESEIYQIPSNPSAVSITKIIPKADPSKGYSEIIKDNKIYYGSGLFLLWNNPTIQSNQLPISEIEIIYQSKKETDTIFGETKITQIAYNEVLEDGATVPESYPLSKESGAGNGGGADLEVESLYETKIGIRITDSLGQYTDTFYTLKNYFKAESPSFGGNLIISQNTFRPFTCIEDDRIIFSSSVARSNSQDKLLYFIDCYVNDRKTTIKLIENIPISSAAFSDNTILSGDILYPENATGNEDIIVKKENATTIHYEVKNKFFKEKLLSNTDLRTPKGNLNPVYNDDFVDVIYKISVRDDFDSRSTVYNSVSTTIKYIEAPTFSHNLNIEIGVNRYIKSENPFYDNSIILLNSSSENNDRIVNPGESIVFKFKRAKDYNGADYLTTMVGDVTKYNIYVSRNDSIIINNYDKLEYTLLKSFNAALSNDGGELKKVYPNDSNDDYYYLEYPLTTYQESKFVIFKVEAVDSKNQKSDFVYSNTYLVPCRATSMDFYVSNVRLYSENNFNPSFRTKVNDFCASIFANHEYSYNNYPNYERNYSIGTENNKQNFSRQGYIILEGSLNGDFNSEVVLLEENQYTNYFSQTINLNTFLGTNKYPDILEKDYGITEFPEEWKTGIEKKDIKKIFFRVTYKIAYGFNDITKDNFDEKYLIVSSTSAPYSFYEDAPTVSYRNHQVGINTKNFSADSTEGQKEVLIIQDNGSYNLVVFKGAEQEITLNLTERTFTATTNNNKEVTINFGTGVIDGMLIDGGEW